MVVFSKFRFRRFHRNKKPKSERQQPSSSSSSSVLLPEKDRNGKNQQRRPLRLIRFRTRRNPPPTPPTAAYTDSAAAPATGANNLVASKKKNATTTTTSHSTRARTKKYNHNTQPTKTSTTPTHNNNNIDTSSHRDKRFNPTERSGSNSSSSSSIRSKRQIQTSGRSTTATLTVYTCTTGSHPFTYFPLNTWIKIATYLSRRDVSHLRLASLGIRPRPSAITLHPALTNHLNLNLDRTPWLLWLGGRRRKNDEYRCRNDDDDDNNNDDDPQTARVWCRREGVIYFPRDISNAELDIFIREKEYLSRSKRVSFGRCRNLTVDWIKRCLPLLSHLEYIEIGLPPHMNNEELSRCLPYLGHVTRLNCVGCSQLNEYGFELIGQLNQLRELYFLHCKNLSSLSFLGNLTKLQKLSIDGMFRSSSRHSTSTCMTPIVNDNTLGIISGKLTSLQSLVIATKIDISGIGLVHISEMRRLECLEFERGAGECITDNCLKVICSLGRLKTLRITHCTLSDRSLNYLQHLHRLEHLELSCCDDDDGDDDNNTSVFTDEGARQLSKLQNVKRLTLSGWENLTNRGLFHLSKMRSVERLSIRNARHITDEGVDVLRNLVRLKELELANCSVTQKVKHSLKIAIGAQVTIW